MKGLTITLLILTTLLIPISCGQHATTTEVKQQDKSFDDFKKVLPEITLPLNLVCGLHDTTASLDDFQEYHQYLPKSVDKIAGVIGDVHGYTFILYGYTGDDISPHLFSYNKEGVIQDSLSLILSGCGGADENAIPVSYAMLDKDLNVTLIDTVKLIHYSNTESIEVYSVDSLRISIVHYTIDANGMFMTK